MLPHCNSGKPANTSTWRRSHDTTLYEANGEELSFPATSHPITQHSLLHISVKQQARLQSEFNAASLELLG